MRATMASTESDSGSAAAHNRFCRQNVHPDPILILGVDGTSGVLDVADALGFIDVQQALSGWRGWGVLGCHGPVVTGVAFSPDGHTLATTSFDRRPFA
jgi:WD40 repeat protein